MARETTKVSTPPGVPDLSKKEVEEAKKDGALAAIEEGGKRQMQVDTGTTGDIDAAAEQQRKMMSPDQNTTQLARFLSLGIEAFEETIDEKREPTPLSEDSVKGILALERNGPNRTAYVQALCKRLGVDSPYEVYHGGPGYTVDVSTVTQLKS